MTASSFLNTSYVFVLAIFVGFLLISKIPSILHTPLMSGTNAIHGIILVGAFVIAANARDTIGIVIGALAVLLATMNVVGGFVVTDRMLEMFRRKPDNTSGNKPAIATSAPQVTSNGHGAKNGAAHHE